MRGANSGNKSRVGQWVKYSYMSLAWPWKQDSLKDSLKHNSWGVVWNLISNHNIFFIPEQLNQRKEWDECPEPLTDRTINDGAVNSQKFGLTWQKFCLSMINDKRKTPATYSDHHKEPVCNLCLNWILVKVKRKTTEICAPFLCKQSAINKNTCYCNRSWPLFTLRSNAIV